MSYYIKMLPSGQMRKERKPLDSKRTVFEPQKTSLAFAKLESVLVQQNKMKAAMQTLRDQETCHRAFLNLLAGRRVRIVKYMSDYLEEYGLDMVRIWDNDESGHIIEINFQTKKMHRYTESGIIEEPFQWCECWIGWQMQMLLPLQKK